MPLSVSGLRQRYGSAVVLDRIGFDVAPGACVALLGRNGAGKTTLLRTLMGVMPTDAGAIAFDGAGMGYVPQGRELFADLTVGQNIEIVPRNHRTPEPDAARDEVTALFPVLGQMWRRRGGDLSGGQQQLAIARALAPRPKLLILDEPTESALRALKDRMAILLVEQYYDVAHSLADAYTVLDRGRVAQAGRGADMDADGVDRFLSV